MQYPITVVMNKAKEEIKRNVKDISNKYSISMDLMAYVFASVNKDILEEANGVLSDMNIETINALDKVLKEKEENEPKEEA